jgi:hypothetical protein
MKLIWIGALLLVFASLASLVSNQKSGQLIDQSWASASNVVPETKLRELERSTPAYAAQIFARLPEPIREKFAAKIRRALELMIFRSLLLWHITPALLIAVIAGSLEGRWARANQKALVKMHSPMGFSLALASLGFIPVLALLWVAAPLAISATLLVFALGTVGIISARNLVVHAPTQF